LNQCTFELTELTLVDKEPQVKVMDTNRQIVLNLLSIMDIAYTEH